MLNHRPILTPEDLFNKVSSYEIFYKYCQNWSLANYQINKLFIGEFRDDNNPSAQIVLSKFGNLYYIDHGEGEVLKPIKFVMRKFNLKFQGALKRIYYDFGIYKSEITANDYGIFNRQPFTPKELSDYRKKETEILKKSRSWNLEDYNYWCSYGWTQDLLNQAQIFPITKFWVNKTEFPIFHENSYSLDYWEDKGIFRRKIYFPERKKNRFLSNVSPNIVQGLQMLSKEGDIVFITKALKDIGAFKRLGYDAVATNSESAFFTNEFVEDLKKRFKRPIIWLDNDSIGVKNAKKFSEEFDLEYIHNPIGSPKDPSDFWKENGGREFNNLIKEKLILTK